MVLVVARNGGSSEATSEQLQLGGGGGWSRAMRGWWTGAGVEM